MCHYSSSRRDEVTLISLCPSENSVSDLITFLVLDQDVVYTEKLEPLPQVTCESCESRVSCVRFAVESWISEKNDRAAVRALRTIQ